MSGDSPSVVINYFYRRISDMITAAIVLRGDENTVDNLVNFIDGMEDVSVVYQKKDTGNLYIWGSPPWEEGADDEERKMFNEAGYSKRVISEW